MAAEYGVMEDPAVPGRKAKWYSDMEASVKANMPLLQGVVIWDTTNVKKRRNFNWDPTSSASALTAWKTFAHDPVLRRHGSVVTPPVLFQAFGTVRLTAMSWARRPVLPTPASPPK